MRKAGLGVFKTKFYRLEFNSVSMADADTPPSSVTIRRSGEIRPRLRPRVRFGPREKVHTFERSMEVALLGKEVARTDDSGPETDTESVVEPPAKKSMLGETLKPVEKWVLVQRGETTEGSIQGTPRKSVPLEEEEAVSDTSMPSLELDEMYGAPGDWEPRPVPMEGSVEDTRVIISEGGEGTPGVAEVQPDHVIPPVKEGEGEKGTPDKGEPLQVPFRVVIPGLEIPAERYSFEDVRSLRLRQEHDHIRQGIKVEEESLRKIVEERETFEKSFLADRAGRLGEHQAQIQNLEQISASIGILETKEVRLRESTEKLVSQNKEISSDILARQMTVSDFDHLIAKQGAKLAELEKLTQQAASDLVRMNDQKVPPKAPDPVVVREEPSTDGTFATAQEPSVMVEEIAAEAATETPTGHDDSMVIHSEDMVSSVSGHSSMLGSKTGKNEEFMMELCGKIETMFQRKLDCFLEETENIPDDGDKNKGVKKNESASNVAGVSPSDGVVHSTPAPASNPPSGTGLGGSINLSAVGQPALAGNAKVASPPAQVPQSQMSSTPPGNGNAGWSGVGKDNIYKSGKPSLYTPQNNPPTNNSRGSQPSSTKTPGTVNAINTPQGRHRGNMSMADELVYQSNPAIRRLGIDAVPCDVGNSRAVDYALEQASLPLRRGMTPVKKHAVKLKVFDGTIPWKRWFTRFASDMRHNGWEGDECLSALSWCLREGPGDPALTSFELSGGTTYEGLVETATWALGPTSGADPAADLEARVQKPDEGHRQFGMALRVLAAEAFETLSPSDPWLVRKLSSLYIDGLSDIRLSNEIASQWKTTMSLADIFELTEDAMRKRKLLRTVEAAAAIKGETPAGEGDLIVEELPEVAALASDSNDPKWGIKHTLYRRRINPAVELVKSEDSKLEAMIGKVMDKKAKGEKAAKVASKGQGKGKKPSKDTVCYNCGKKGHFARTCWSKDTKKVSSVEEQKNEPTSDQSPPPTGN